ncbi:MAG TPA: hypothetical protein VFR23_21045 [Jiangellaceae bacterium]|nr:hypothetical protein [Jiangellaceae bacterium]
MSRPHPLTAHSEREWAQAWEAEQHAMDALNSQRGSWLPNVVDARDWGAIKFTSGRPGHAGATGQAAVDSVAVFHPDLTDRAARSEILHALRDRPPVQRVLGFGFREHHVRGAVIGAITGTVAGAALGALLGADVPVVVAAAVVGLLAGVLLGTAITHYRFKAHRREVLTNVDHVRRIPMGKARPAAPRTWGQVVEAATQVDVQLAGRRQPDPQTRRAVHMAVWEAAVLVQQSSDHTGLQVLVEELSSLANRLGAGRG